MEENSYPPIADYAFLGDCHSVALVSRSGAIDWCCMPRIDLGSSFGRLLDWETAGYCQIAPVDDYTVSRRYLDDTLVLETTFHREGAEVRLTDCFTMHEGGRRNPHQQIIRFVECDKGEMTLRFDIVPRFDYGTLIPWIRSYRDDHYVVMGGDDGLLVSGDVDLALKDRHRLVCEVTLSEGERRHLSLLFRPPADLDDGIVDIPSIGELQSRMEETVAWWRNWSSQQQVEGFHADCVRRSAVVLKALTYSPTGAIAAAPTTSLPEVPGGSMNWDYRFSWIRDSTLTLRSLARIGFKKEAEGFRRFVERTAAGSADQLQVLFGVGGERRLAEQIVEGLEGYGGAAPVRIGNAAKDQLQLDVYGELFELSWRWYQGGDSPDESYWEFLTGLANGACESWSKRDRGIWEIRKTPRHYVHSKVMCWVALDRAIRMAEGMGEEAPLDRWRQSRKEIREAVVKQGYDAKRGVFVQAFDHPVMDAALLRLPLVDFIDYRDERMVRTVDAIREDLMDQGLVRRYPLGLGDGAGEEGEDEGVFIACSFWLAECLARQGRWEAAMETFDRAIETGNDLMLFSEEYDPRKGLMLGNFPQGLTHLSLVAAAVTMEELKGETEKIE